MTATQISATPGYPDDCPPIGAMPLPGVAEPFERLRITVHDRPLIQPRVWETGHTGLPVTHPYVRRYWTAILGPGAIADLLRLATAASRRRSLPRPVHLSQLARAGFVRRRGGVVEVKTLVPEVPAAFYPALPPALRRELATISTRTRPTPSTSSGASS